MLQLVARLLTKAVVERAAAGAADLVEHTIKHDASSFVFVEALVDEVAQEAAGLRDTPADGACDARQRITFGGAGVLEEADDVAGAGETNANHARVAGAVDHVVDQPRLEATVERDRSGAGEAPGAARDLPRRIGG